MCVVRGEFPARDGCETRKPKTPMDQHGELPNSTHVVSWTPSPGKHPLAVVELSCELAHGLGVLAGSV